MASTQNTYVSSYTSMKTAEYPMDDPRRVSTMAVQTPRFSLLPLSPTTYLGAPKSILAYPKRQFYNGNKNYIQTGFIKKGCTFQEMFQSQHSFEFMYCNGQPSGDDKFLNLKGNRTQKEEAKKNPTDLANKESFLLTKVDTKNGQGLVTVKEDSSLSDYRTEGLTATINSSNSINTNINSAKTDSQIIKSKWNVPSPSTLIPTISSGSKCLMGHKKVLTASLHTTVAHYQPLLTSDCYPPVTVEMEAPSVSHCSPLLYDSANATACQYINYNKHMLEIKQQLARQPSQQGIGIPDQHNGNGQSEEGGIHNLINTDLLSIDQKVEENYLKTEDISSNQFYNVHDPSESKSSPKTENKSFITSVKLEESNLTDFTAENKLHEFQNDSKTSDLQLNENVAFSTGRNYFLNKALNDLNNQMKLEEGFWNKEGGAPRKENMVSSTRDLLANDIADVAEDIDGQVVKRVSHSTLAALYHRQSGDNSSNTITSITFLPSTGNSNRSNSDSTWSQLAGSDHNQTYQQLLPNAVTKDSSASKRLQRPNKADEKPENLKDKGTQELRLTGECDIANTINKCRKDLLHFNQDRVSNQCHTINNSESGGLDEDKMEGDIDVETSSNSSRSNSPAVDMSNHGRNMADKKDDDHQEDPQDLSMKTNQKAPMIIAPVASSMGKLNELSSSKCIKIEPIMSPYLERFDHKDYRCSPSGLHVIVPNTSSHSLTNSLNTASINTKLGGQCIGDKNGQVNHNNVAVINYGKRHNANDCNGKMSNNGQRENGHNLAAVGGVNGCNKYSNNNTSSSFSVHTMVCGSKGSSPGSIYSTGLTTVKDKTELSNKTVEMTNANRSTCSGNDGKDDSDLHIVVDQDFSDSEEQTAGVIGSKRARMSAGDGVDLSGKQENGSAESTKHFTQNVEDGPTTPGETDTDAHQRDNASAKDSDEVK